MASLDINHFESHKQHKNWQSGNPLHVFIKYHINQGLQTPLSWQWGQKPREKQNKNQTEGKVKKNEWKCVNDGIRDGEMMNV